MEVGYKVVYITRTNYPDVYQFREIVECVTLSVRLC